jgi:hypothetical protein
MAPSRLASFRGLELNFSWWVNRKDLSRRNLVAGGFLGLDDIGVFDRSAKVPTGGSLEQADGTAWMAFYCQSMLEVALILAEPDPVYEEIAFDVAALEAVDEHRVTSRSRSLPPSRVPVPAATIAA